MKVLGIESSCDETGVAVYDTARGGAHGLLAQAIYSQIALHAQYGGVVPELASRDHVRKTLPLVHQTLDEAGIAGRGHEAVLEEPESLADLVGNPQAIVPYLVGSDRVVRPANMGSHAPGKGLAVVPARDGTPVAVINVIGSLFLQTPISLWEQIDGLVEEAQRRAKVIVVDIHAEATSEKVALARWLDGKVTLVVGTHTHVQTNDARVSRAGTAALTDAGMTGPHASVIGVQAELAIRRMRTNMPVRFETAAGDVRLEGALVECNGEGRASSCTTVRVSV